MVKTEYLLHGGKKLNATEPTNEKTRILLRIGKGKYIFSPCTFSETWTRSLYFHINKLSPQTLKTCQFKPSVLIIYNVF